DVEVRRRRLRALLDQRPERVDRLPVGDHVHRDPRPALGRSRRGLAGDALAAGAGGQGQAGRHGQYRYPPGEDGPPAWQDADARAVAIMFRSAAPAGVRHTGTLGFDVATRPCSSWIVPPVRRPVKPIDYARGSSDYRLLLRRGPI